MVAEVNKVITYSAQRQGPKLSVGMETQDEFGDSCEPFLAARIDDSKPVSLDRIFEVLQRLAIKNFLSKGKK